jgi:hypothetical protein
MHAAGTGRGVTLRTVRAARARSAAKTRRPAPACMYVRPCIQCSTSTRATAQPPSTTATGTTTTTTRHALCRNPMGRLVRAVRAFVCTSAAPVLTQQLGLVGERASHRARSSVFKHLLVRVICAKSPIPRCHHATTALVPA